MKITHIIIMHRKGVYDEENHHMNVIMKSVNESMLTPKDVLYLTDVLDQTLVLNKRVGHDITMLQNAEVKKCFEHVNEKLREHYDALLKILEKEVKK